MIEGREVVAAQPEEAVRIGARILEAGDNAMDAVTEEPVEVCR